MQNKVVGFDVVATSASIGVPLLFGLVASLAIIMKQRKSLKYLRSDEAGKGEQS